MSYPIDYTFSLGTAGLTVNAQLYTTAGAASGAAITTGIVELGNGWYSYNYAAMAPTFRGSIKFYDSADASTCVYFAVDGVNVGSVDGVAVELEALDKTGYTLTSDYDAAKTAAQAGDKMDLLDTLMEDVV